MSNEETISDQLTAIKEAISTSSSSCRNWNLKAKRQQLGASRAIGETTAWSRGETTT
jgi:hypothetical protein